MHLASLGAGAHWCIKWCAECLGHMVIGVLMIFSIFMYAAGVMILESDPYQESSDGFIAAWLQAKGWGWVMWFAYNLPVYAILYSKAKAGE